MMPSKPLHPCNHPGCPKLTSGRYCPDHEKRERERYDASRGSSTERGYDHRWHKIRDLKLSRDLLCERCFAKGYGVPAVLVHHKDHNPKNNNHSNHESLCDACHEREHADERWRGRGESRRP